jgi:hypothetical protein
MEKFNQPEVTDIVNAIGQVQARKSELEKEITDNKRRQSLYNQYIRETDGGISFTEFLNKKFGNKNAAHFAFDGFELDDSFTVNEKYQDVLNKKYQNTVNEYRNIIDVEAAFVGADEWANSIGGTFKKIGKSIGKVASSDAAKAIATGGLSLTKPGKKVADTKVGTALLSGGLSTKVGQTVATGGLNTKVGETVATGGLNTRVGRAVATGGLSETKAGKKVTEKVQEKVNKMSDVVGQAAEKGAKWVEEKGLQILKTLALAPMRIAFMGVVEINVWGLASDFEKVHQTSESKWTALMNLWYKLGGNRTKLKDSIKRGSKRKALKLKLGKSKGADGSVSFSVYSESDLPTNDKKYFNMVTEAMVVSATTIIVAALGVIGQAKASQQDNESAESAEDIAARQAAQLEAEMKIIADAQANGIDTEKTDLDNTKIWIYAGIAFGLIVIGTILYFALKKKK